MLTLLFPKAHPLFHVNDTHAPAKASSELRPPRCCRRRSREIVVHVAFAPLGDLDKGCRRHRTSGVAKGEQQEKEKKEEDVRSCRRRRSCQPEMSDHGCIHLNNFKAAKGIQPYKVIHSYFVTSTSTEARVRKVRLSFSRVRFADMVLCYALFRDFHLAPPCVSLAHFRYVLPLSFFFYLFLSVHQSPLTP